MKWEVRSMKCETRSESRDDFCGPKKSTINQFEGWDLKIEFTEVKNLVKATIGIGFLMPSS